MISVCFPRIDGNCLLRPFLSVVRAKQRKAERDGTANPTTPKAKAVKSEPRSSRRS